VAGEDSPEYFVHRDLNYTNLQPMEATTANKKNDMFQIVQ
jgi:hypothetical protein